MTVRRLNSRVRELLLRSLQRVLRVWWILGFVLLGVLAGWLTGFFNEFLASASQAKLAVENVFFSTSTPPSLERSGSCLRGCKTTPRASTRAWSSRTFAISRVLSSFARLAS